MYSSDGIYWVYQFPFEEDQQKFVKNIVKHSTNVMIWASIARAGTGSVHFVEGNMEAGQYVRILEGHLKTDGQKLCRSAFVEEQESIGSEYCASQVDSMPIRLDALAKTKGGHTEY
ncbi:MAG: hypothetical protein EZS28_036592 [Streblomastix strix]|uniref:Uncharacterized protein n=1 Tax=Streblomastix strix TaxID=222440 RepID=A0A5J4UCI9_9EUKA|nr:MAG: hypothetical protein EZS28_036592 [Streblomastix strix]